ncbi:hypothetical protein D3C86_2154120 [compost metagenome]
MKDIHMGKPDADVHPHTAHGITREWEAAAIDAVVEARASARRQASEASTGPNVETKPTKVKKNGKNKP